MASHVLTYYDYRTPYGSVTIAVRNGAICAVRPGKLNMDGEYKPTKLSNSCATELLEYFAGKRRVFNLPISADGSAFQHDVWRAVEAIPYGQTRTSSNIAQSIGKPDSFRMVGAAAKANPILALIPTHRIVNKSNRNTEQNNYARLNAIFREIEQRYA